MEQKQNSFENVAANDEREDAGNKKIWVTPELRVMPVPASTQTGKRVQKTAETNSIYRIAS